MNKQEKKVVCGALSDAFKNYMCERNAFGRHLKNDNPRFPLEPKTLVEARARFLALRDVASKLGIKSAAYLLSLESMITAECELEEYKPLR